MVLVSFLRTLILMLNAFSLCRYCDREFDDDKTLILHQKAKHFKCQACGKRLNSTVGMAVHMEQVHKEVINK
jgi:DNA-directed RNA polymerase subunit RPC12/RpoP